MLNSFASAGRRALPNQWDLIAFAASLAILTAIAKSYHGISAPLPAPNESPISLDYWQLPYYALRTTLRMFAALAASLVFTFTYATLAAKSGRAEMVLIPVLDILQSVPILGFLSFTVAFFLIFWPETPWSKTRGDLRCRPSPGTAFRLPSSTGAARAISTKFAEFRLTLTRWLERLPAMPASSGT